MNNGFARRHAGLDPERMAGRVAGAWLVRQPRKNFARGAGVADATIASPVTDLERANWIASAATRIGDAIVLRRGEDADVYATDTIQSHRQNTHTGAA